ncbi:hypothetical protein KKB64_04825 [Patescibacteria group bacterium]|nr:hypothetical protein [Patescibacteria group bacterium]MBU1473075.1 hypothetical protein [Patescibacteria group bacterium]MBU2460169.1 hypothetical protein [Patescibacteria group bacterium]MBU2544485.1 hypothetical protein [Patescibacteria group bacterium]
MIVYISNVSEDVWPFISSISQAQAREFEIQENANLAERDLFSFPGEDHFLFVSPRSISRTFLDYYIGLFGNKHLSVSTPKVHTGVICEDILADDDVMDEIAIAANGAKRLTLVSYTASPQFLALVSELRKKGFNVYTPEAPEQEDAWTVNFFGSKSGIRQLAQKSAAVEPDFVMADGLVCSGIGDAAKIAAKKYIREKGVVVKTNKGHSGAGVLIFRQGDLPENYDECEEQIKTTLSRDGYWEKFPIVIESFVKENRAVAGGFPNVEFKIAKHGEVEFLYYCALRVTPEGVFKGIEIQDEAVSDKLGARMMDTGFYVGEQYASYGYRGYFDVDFVASRNGQLYVTESNTRRTGGTHVYETTKALFGKNFMTEVYTLSNNIYPLPKRKQIFLENLLNALSPILFDKKSKEGLIVASEHILNQGAFSYIIYGQTKKRALAIEEKMEEIVQKLV